MVHVFRDDSLHVRVESCGDFSVDSSVHLGKLVRFLESDLSTTGAIDIVIAS